MTLETYRARKPFVKAWEEQGKIIGRASNDSFEEISIEELNPVSHKGDPKYWVINDEYLKFRLALMRGDSIEWQSDGNTWNVLGDEIRFTDALSNYRIIKKPDTSWIVDGGYCRSIETGKVSIMKVVFGQVSVPRVQRYECDKLKFMKMYAKWEPLAGEIVWAWYRGALPVLGECLKVWDTYVCIEGNAHRFDKVAPYIGDEFWVES